MSMNNDQGNYKVYKYRWIILASYMLIMLMQQIFFITYSPIAPLAAKEFGVSESSVILLVMVYFITTILFSFPAGWMADKYGPHRLIFFGALCTGIFGLIRGLFPTDYNIVLISSIVISLGGPFMVTPVAKLASVWFAPQERVTIMGMGIFSVYMGILIGMVVSPFLVTTYGFSHMTLILGIAGFISMIPYMVFGRKRPKTPSGPSETEEISNLKSDLIQLVKKPNYLIFSIQYIITSGIGFTIATLIAILLRDTKLSIEQVGIIGGVMLFAGTVTCTLWGMLSDKTSKRLVFILTGILLSIPAILLLNYGSTFIIILLGAVLYGSFITGLGPVTIAYAAEAAHPVCEGTSVGIFFTCGQSGALIIISLSQYMLAETGISTQTLLNLFAVVSLMVFILCAALLHENKPAQSTHPAKCRKKPCNRD